MGARIRLMLGLLILCVLVLVTAGRLMGGSGATMNSLSQVVGRSVESFVSDRVTMPNDSVAVSVALPVFAVGAHEVADFHLDLLSTKPVIGIVPVKVTFLLDDGTSMTYAATARVRVFATVLVAAERLNRHQIVNDGMLRAERREVTHLTDAYFTDPAQVTGKRVRRIISAGKMLKASDIEAVPLVDRGDGVTVAVVLGKVTVTSKAKALEGGEMGDLIKVRDLTTGKRLVGIVAGKSLVVLDESML